MPQVVRSSKWRKSLKLAQVTWMYMFVPSITAVHLQKYDIAERTLRRYAAIAKSRDPTLEQTGVIWDWDPSTFRLPSWPKASDPIYTRKGHIQESIPMSPYALAYAGGVAPVGCRGVRGFTTKIQITTPPPTPIKRKHAVCVPIQTRLRNKTIVHLKPTSTTNSKTVKSALKSVLKLKRTTTKVPNRVRFAMGGGDNRGQMDLDVWREDYEVPRQGWMPSIRRVQSIKPVNIDLTDWSIPPVSTDFADTNLPILATVDGVQVILCGGSIVDLLESVVDTNTSLIIDVLGF
jgi:hypothetical protein